MSCVAINFTVLTWWLMLRRGHSGMVPRTTQLEEPDGPACIAIDLIFDHRDLRPTTKRCSFHTVGRSH